MTAFLPEKTIKGFSKGIFKLYCSCKIYKIPIGRNSWSCNNLIIPNFFETGVKGF
ncbi:MAG: hypothetical protein QW757_02525 [Candidatus Woesearchaeota archaeon]